MAISSGGTATILHLYVGSTNDNASEGGTKIVARNATPIAAQMLGCFGPGARMYAATGQPKPTQRIALRVLFTHGVRGRTLMGYQFTAAMLNNRLGNYAIFRITVPMHSTVSTRANPSA